MTYVEYYPLHMSGEQHEGAWVSYGPASGEVKELCEKVEAMARERNLRVMSITPVTGSIGQQHRNPTTALVTQGNTAGMTCGLIVVFEG